MGDAARSWETGAFSAPCRPASAEATDFGVASPSDLGAEGCATTRGVFGAGRVAEPLSGVLDSIILSATRGNGRWSVPNPSPICVPGGGQRNTLTSPDTFDPNRHL